MARPYLHPTVSRLRSYTPGSSRLSSEPSAGNLSPSLSFAGPSSTPSALSRVSSHSNLHTESVVDEHGLPQPTEGPADVFKWAELRDIDRQLKAAHKSPKISNILGAPSIGLPTVLAANGLICIGTDEGKVCVFDFDQKLKCICGGDTKNTGAVTAVALSFDQTYVVSGHATGLIQLFELKSPRTPVRSVQPTTVAAVASGVKEGHVQGSRIVSVGFVAGRHTAVITADDHASDILRILGKYDLESFESPSRSQGTASALPVRRRKSKYSILSMMPLPLGTVSHPTDAYNLVALLTPTKLVVVGLKPTPRTWFKCTREDLQDTSRRKGRHLKGSLSWFPSVLHNVSGKVSITDKTGDLMHPRLMYSWGRTLYIMQVIEARIKQPVRHSRSGKASELEVGTITFENLGKWTSIEEILSAQWFNINQILMCTAKSLEIYDVRLKKLVERAPFDGLSLVSPSLAYTSQGATSYVDSVGDIAHSIRIYKGRIYLLGREIIQRGTLLTWAHQIVKFLDKNDSLGAIEMARSYYLDTAPGNRNDLPEADDIRKEVIGDRMRQLLAAATEHAFSEQRMLDETHMTPDGRGVDRTNLFEGWWQRLLEKFVLDNEIRIVPPRITQRLVAMHAEDGRPDLVERVIWHIDPACLDLNQAIQLCQRHHLYDALIYVYTRALRDYVAPVVELLGLMRKINQHRRSRESWNEESMEPLVLNAYKIYPYLANVLSGLTYPSEEPLPPEEAFQAKKDVYTFLFFGRSSIWPAGEGGRLVLTSDEEVLLRFDAESFLHSLDIAFEDSYLNDSKEVSRLVIISILLEILSSRDLSPPPTLHDILIGLASDPDASTREDRQLAAEYLLSAYTPHEGDKLVTLFTDAGFYRILRTWHYQEQRWAPLLETYLDDPDQHASEIYGNLDEVLTLASPSGKHLPLELVIMISDELEKLLQMSLASTAILLDKHVPDLHERALEKLGPDGDQQRFVYLQYLFGPAKTEDDDYIYLQRGTTPQFHPEKLYEIYISLQCQFSPKDVIEVAKHLSSGPMQWADVVQICEAKDVYDAVVWALDQQGLPMQAIEKAETFEKKLTLKVLDGLSGDAVSDVETALQELVDLGRAGISVCFTRSNSSSRDVPLEDVWFRLLSSQINCIQTVSASCSPEALSTSPPHDTSLEMEWRALDTLRSLVRETFSSLVSISSTRGLSFPRLFKQLVNSAAEMPLSKGTHYTEFRTILTGMLESYRSEGDMLFITKHLLDRDLFETVAVHNREQICGWRPSLGICSACRKPFVSSDKSNLSPIRMLVDERLVG
ncbi:Golgi CORVET complex core vacuolar protein 8-domain-containing protein [Mucidula mucida]|nr:Golgi CORVET complex core vacuolar protein 8-domain-containing protein [Mucidula mucida]